MFNAACTCHSVSIKSAIDVSNVKVLQLIEGSYDFTIIYYTNINILKSYIKGNMYFLETEPEVRG